MLVNYKHQCTPTNYKKVQFFISPSKGIKDVEVCVLPVLRSATKYSNEDIMTLGQCIKKPNADGQYVATFDLDPAEYVALIYAHRDYTSVQIPALSSMFVKDHYEFLFSMQSCGNTVSFLTSDSYSITLANSYVWAPLEAPRVTVYYSDNMKLQVKDIAKFSKKTFRGEHGINTKNYRITGLKPATRYQFFVFVEENTTGTSFMKPLISGREYGRTYATCKDDTWPEVGVNEESKIDCTIGHHAYYCSKMPEYAANFTTEINSCYCPEETIGGITYNQTRYGDYAYGPNGRRRCGWKGIWENAPSKNCEADGDWEGAYDGQWSVKRCENGGQLKRLCVFGELQEVVDENCKCPQVLHEEVLWDAANRNETIPHACGVGSLSRHCSEWGWWEDLEDEDCRCATDGMWEERPRDTTQYEQCGTQGVQDNQYSRRCRGDGFWEDVNYGQCVCDAETVDEISWESTPMDEAAWIQCGSGSKARICLPGGIWDSNVADYNCMCTADMEWNPTPAGVQVELPCPDNPEKVQTRRCRNDGVWEDVNSIGCYGSCPVLGRFPVTLSGKTASVECEEGGGRILMDCLRKVDANGDYYGEWDESSWRVDGTCRCASNDEFSAADVNTNAEIACDSGKRTKKCGKYTALWEKAENNDCQCTVKEALEAGLSPVFTPVFERAEVACGVGSRSVLCGRFGHYENEDDSQCFCQSSEGFLQTHAGESTSAPCLEVNDRSRACRDSGFWSEIDYSQCQCQGLSSISGRLLPNATFTKECSVGRYHVECSVEGETTIVEKSCACPATRDFPQTPAGTHFSEACGSKEKSAFCNLDGVWSGETNPCFCEASGFFPETPYGETTDAIPPQCFKATCNPETGMFDEDYSGCGCAATGVWPAMAHNTTETVPCTTGGFRTATCFMGVLREEFNDCKCSSTTGEMVEVGDYEQFPCMLGYILKQCRGDNFWYNVTDAYCGCASPEPGLKEFEHVEAGKSKTVKCGAGWMSIQCDATGHFNQSSLVNQCKCPLDDVWGETAAGETAVMACHGNREMTVERKCGELGEWEEPVGSCMCMMDGEWPATGPGEHTITCDSGVVIRRVCNEDGQWQEPTGSCLDRSCPTDGPFIRTPHKGSYTHVCGNGHRITRTCNAGIWSPVDWSECGCADEDGFIGDEFIDPRVNSTFSSQKCDEGERLRECRYGVWQDVIYTNCFCSQSGPLKRTRALEDTEPVPCHVGSIDAVCSKEGHWKVLNDTCSCPAEEVKGALFGVTPRNNTATASCLSGSLTRFCGLDGEWQSVESGDCQCVAPGWTPAAPMEYGYRQCDSGSLRQKCLPNGTWDRVESNSCMCSARDPFDNTPVGETATFQCEVGSLSATCTIGGWGEVTDEGCGCNARDGYAAVMNGQVATKECGTLQIGMKSRMCVNGRWGREDTSMCVNYCMKQGEWDYTRPNTTATLPCPEGYSDGILTRFCNEQGLWEQGVSTCKPLRCPAEGVYPITPINGVATASCPEGMTGSRTRRCELKNGKAVWGAEVDGCNEAFCTLGGSRYEHNAKLTLVCPEGQVGEVQKVCRTGEWEVVSDTCVSVRCPADPEQNLPEGVFGNRYHVNCGVDYTGMLVMYCNARQQWERESGTCTPMVPTLRCQPASGAENVPLSTVSDGQYTVLCTSNVRVKEVVNDQLENMNVHIVFTSAESMFSYPTEAVFLSDYTVAFVFQGSFPPKSEGALYINRNSFLSYTGIRYPADTMVQSFVTQEGTPLSPKPLPESAIRIVSVNYAERTVVLQMEMPFDSEMADQGELVFIGSNLHSVRFTEPTVIVEGAILNSVLAIRWRTRRGDYWSPLSDPVVYRPLVLLPPSKPVVATFASQEVEWKWEEAELFGQPFSFYAWELLVNGVVQRNGTTQENSLRLSLETEKVYQLRVAVHGQQCVPECTDIASIFSELSEGFTASETLLTPSVPRNLIATAVSSTSQHLTWEAPASTGGGAILSYRVRRASDAAMQSVVATYEVTEPELLLTEVTAVAYVEVAAFNGFLSAPVRVTVTPQPLEAVWTTNGDEEALDNAVVVKGRFNYLAMGSCAVTDAAHPEFSYSFAFGPETAVREVVQPLAPETRYQFVCDVQEVGSEAVSRSEFAATTAATADLTPSLLVDGEPTSSATATVAVTANLLGELRCYVAPYEGLQSRPTSTTGFGSNWVQSARVTDVATPVHFLFVVDVDGNVIDVAKTYHAWCLMERSMLRYTETGVEVARVVFPEYKPAEARRRLLQEVPFEIVKMTPAEFAVDVDPNADIQLQFSQPATVGEGAVTLLSADNEMVRVLPEQIRCLRNVCVLHMEGGLRSRQQYVLNVEQDAFLAETKPLENAKESFFETGLERCDTTFVSKGLGSSKMCECFSVEGMCQCQCGETAVSRAL